MSTRTRKKSSCRLSLYLGVGNELISSELPTVRDILRYGLLQRELSEKDKRNLLVDELVTMMSSVLITQWEKANPMFMFPVLNHEKTITKKLKCLWEQAVRISEGKGKIEDKARFTAKLDKLVDVLNCKCTMFICSELGCKEECNKEVHIKCSCPAEKKIPVTELIFVRAQRDKIGSLSTYRMDSVNMDERRRQKAAKSRQKERKQKEERRKDLRQEKKRRLDEAEKRQQKEAETFLHNESEDEDSSSNEECMSNKYNKKDISNIALASIRHHTGLRETAEIATAAWIDAGLINDLNHSLIIDHNKVRRAQERVISSLQESFTADISCHGVECILFDGRKDNTNVLLEIEGNKQKFPGMIKEEHYTVCSEPGGKYLFHFTPEEASKQRKHAEIIANHLVAWLEERQLTEKLLAIGADSTNVNTGWQGGVIQWVEQKLKKNLVWIVCDLHTGELPLRHLIIELDGPTLSGNKWSGPLGSMLDSATDLEINPHFKKVSIGPDLPELKREVIADLSTDQYYAYMMTKSVKTGVLPVRLSMLEIGPMNHSRWLTTACRFLRLWVSKHGLKAGKTLTNLQLIVEFIVGVYIPNWFNIKVNHGWEKGPNHLLYQLQLLRSQNKKVINIVMPYVERNAYYAHPESVLQAMLCSNIRYERDKAVEVIMSIRGNDIPVDKPIRVRKNRPINPHAESLSELTDLSTNPMEPPLTTHLTDAQLQEIVENPMKVPDWPSHTQSVERCVKMVTEAASKVFSHEKREGFIRGQFVSRNLMSINRSKQDLVPMTSFKM